MTNFSKLLKMQVITAGVLLVSSVLALAVLAPSGKAFATGDSCSSVPATTYGIDTLTLTAPAAASYTIWVRMKVPTTGDTIFLNVNGTCFNVGGNQTDT